MPWVSVEEADRYFVEPGQLLQFDVIHAAFPALAF